MRRFQNGLVISGMAPKRRLLMVLFAIFWEQTLITVKSDPKFENKSLFHAKFYRARHEKIFESQN